MEVEKSSSSDREASLGASSEQANSLDHKHINPGEERDEIHNDSQKSEKTNEANDKSGPPVNEEVLSNENDSTFIAGQSDPSYPEDVEREQALVPQNAANIYEPQMDENSGGLVGEANAENNQDERGSDISENAPEHNGDNQVLQSPDQNDQSELTDQIDDASHEEHSMENENTDQAYAYNPNTADSEIYDNEIESGTVEEESSIPEPAAATKRAVKRPAPLGDRNLRSRRTRAYKRIRASILDLEDDNYEDNYMEDREENPEFDPEDTELERIKKEEELNESSDDDEERFEPCVIVVNRKVFGKFSELMESLDVNGSVLLKRLLQCYDDNMGGVGRKRQRKSANPKPIRRKRGRPRVQRACVKYSDDEDGSLVNGGSVTQSTNKKPEKKTTVTLKRVKRKYNRRKAKAHDLNSMKIWQGIPEGDPNDYEPVEAPYEGKGITELAFTFVDTDGIRKVKCRVCGKESARKWHTMEHLRTHTGERPHKCDQCPASFKQLHHLREHKKTHTEDRPFSCPICFKCFRTDEKLSTHIARHTSGSIGKEKALNPNAKVFSCSSCSYMTTVRSDLIKHEVKHGEKIYKCDYCEFRTAWKKNLKDHMIRHTGAMPYACDCCDFKTNDRHALRTHKIKANHRQEFVCEVCGAIFDKQKLLSNHMIEHTGEKPYKCEHCDYSTRFRSGLRAHRLIHSTYRGYVCELCGKEFRQRGHLVCHQRNMHATPDGKSYICQQCGYTAATSQSFNSHMRKHKPKLKPGETRPPAYIPKAPGTNRGRPRKVRNADGSKTVVRDKDKMGEDVPEEETPMVMHAGAQHHPGGMEPMLSQAQTMVHADHVISQPQMMPVISASGQGIPDPILIVAARAMEELQGQQQQQAVSQEERKDISIIRETPMSTLAGREQRHDDAVHSVINLTPVPVDATVSRGSGQGGDLAIMYTHPGAEQERHEAAPSHLAGHSHMDMRYMAPQAHIEREQHAPAARPLGHIDPQQGMMYGMMGGQGMHGMTALMAGLAAITDYGGQAPAERQNMPSNAYPQYHPHQQQPQHHHQQQ